MEDKPDYLVVGESTRSDESGSSYYQEVIDISEEVSKVADETDDVKYTINKPRRIIIKAKITDD